MMNGVIEKFKLSPGESIEQGVAKISAFEISSTEAMFHNLRNRGDFRLNPDKYIRLHIKGEGLMMSDTPMERRSNEEFVRQANGHVLIAGLGIGLIIHALKEKDQTGMIKSITVVEKYKDVIDLVGPTLPEGVKIIEADIFEFKPDMKYDTIYFDIWPDISTGNLDEIRILHNRFKNKVNRDNPAWFMDSWMKNLLRGLKRKEDRGRW